jgi:long-chain acyl-CoA synthetase
MKAQIVGYFGENVLYETYGSTEAGIVSSIGPGDQLRKLDCVGTPFPDTDIRILDEHGRGCSLGEAGELFSRSPYQFDGYWNKPLETASALKDGWVSVGDIARQDDEGFLYIVGRKKDMIISGGINIYPREVEDVLVSHPDVAEAAVFGVPDEKWGQRLRAVVVMSGRKSVTANDIISHCQGKLASFKIPREIAFRGSLPRNPLGKVMKDELQATWEEITG